MEQKQYEVLCGFMDHLTKGYNWYYDTPERRFEHSPKSIWLINPKTEEWVVQLEKGGWMWWNWDFYLNFQRYFNMEQSDFERFIKIWVEDVLNRGVSSTAVDAYWTAFQVEDVLNRGVSSTHPIARLSRKEVEDVLNRGVSSTSIRRFPNGKMVEDVLNRGVSTTGAGLGLLSMAMEDVLNHGKTIQ